MGGGDDQSYFSASQLPYATGGEEHFVPSKMGYLHIKNQVGDMTCVTYSLAMQSFEFCLSDRVDEPTASFMVRMVVMSLQN